MNGLSFSGFMAHDHHFFVVIIIRIQLISFFTTTHTHHCSYLDFFVLISKSSLTFKLSNVLYPSISLNKEY